MSLISSFPSYHIFALPLLQELFEEIDTDGSGGISITELSEGLRKQGYVLSDSELEQLGRKMDFDSNNNIDLTEFMTTLIDWSMVQRGQKWQVHAAAGDALQGGSDTNMSHNGWIGEEVWMRWQKS